jgi:hypothetical protein
MSDVPRVPTVSPPPARVRLTGKLDMVRASDAGFTLVTDDGRVIPGRLVGRPVEELARWLNRAVVVFGSGQFDSLGNLTSVEADGFLPENTLLPGAPSLAGRTAEEREEMARRLRAAVGAWPGDETDEAVEQALRELS